MVLKRMEEFLDGERKAAGFAPWGNPVDETTGQVFTGPGFLDHKWECSGKKIRMVARRYPFRVSRHYAGLIRDPGDPIWRQVMPDPAELEDSDGFEDPLAEERLSPVPNLVHRYPNRVLWLVSHECALHCRFCTRKRRWEKPRPMTDESFEAGLAYIEGHRQVQDVLLSGGDPLLLPFHRLETILRELRRIRHVQIVRIGTRVPCALPERITENLAAMLKQYHPIYVNIHFNHPLEINPQSSRACALLADAGIPLGSQTVLLKGVNDDSGVLAKLFQGLLVLRVRPYYLMQMDLTRGTSHFRTPVSTGIRLLQSLRNRISGPAMPHFVVDLPGGHGKIPLVPQYVEEIRPDSMVLRDYLGSLCVYPLLQGEAADLKQWIRIASPAP